MIFKNKKFLFLILLIVISLTLYHTVLVFANDKDNFGSYLKLFTEVFAFIEKDYVNEEKIDYKELIYGAINGMLKTLDDPYTRLLPPKSYEDMKVETEGHFGGLGIEITIKDGVLTVMAPIFGTPAFEAGIQPGDQIIKIEGVSTEGITLEEAVGKLRGKPGSKVTITINRSAFADPIDFTLIRAEIKLDSVYSKKLTEKIGYVNITKFQMTTADELTNSLNELKNNNVEKLIIDLRNNPGGLLNSACDVADLFLDEGVIVYTKGRSGRIEQKFYSKDNNTIFPDIPLVVLVNQGSASGSEIVTGALKDRNRAIVLGKTTYGKGSVQTVRNLSGGAGLVLTTAKYYTPAGISIDGSGIEPNIVIDQPMLSKEEIEGIRKIITTDYIFNFVEDREDYTDEDVDALIETLKTEENIILPREHIIHQIKIQEYRKKGLKYFADLDTDKQLKKAVEIMNAFDIFKKVLQ